MGGRGGGGGKPKRPATRACANTGARQFAYRWNRDAPFPGRFSRTRGDRKRTRTEASSGSEAGEPLPKEATGGRLKRRLRHWASPGSDPRMPPGGGGGGEDGRERARPATEAATETQTLPNGEREESREQGG